MKTFIGLVLAWGLSFTLQAQTVTKQMVHLLEPGSKGNTLELTVANQAGAGVVQGVSVSVLRAPTGIRFTTELQQIDSLAGGAERSVGFFFDVDRNVPLNKTDTVLFSLRDERGNAGEKLVLVRYAGPAIFALDQNYPNPFNPVTTIQYQLPTDSKVSLRVYDVIGREIVVLVKEERPAGYHDVQWNAAGVASGVYFYRIEVAPLNGGGTFQNVRKLIILK
jgi:hypothetical protein